MTETVDPLKRHEERLSSLVGKLLDLAEETGSDVTMPQLINTAKAVSSILVVLLKIREAAREPSEQPGSEVRKYASAFAPAASARRRAADSEPASSFTERDWSDGGEDDDGDDASPN